MLDQSMAVQSEMFEVMSIEKAFDMLDANEPEFEVDLGCVKVAKTFDELGKPVILVMNQMRSCDQSAVSVRC